ncbi:MAG: hypothetical protein IPO22_03985 [Anaerolineales bacterium]|nr:hypothetical protein [Anaerolineales bacterium]
MITTSLKTGSRTHELVTRSRAFGLTILSTAQAGCLDVLEDVSLKLKTALRISGGDPCDGPARNRGRTGMAGLPRGAKPVMPA